MQMDIQSRARPSLLVSFAIVGVSLRFQPFIFPKIIVAVDGGSFLEIVDEYYSLRIQKYRRHHLTGRL